MTALPDMMPEHDDGMLDLRELGRTLVETLVNEIMGAQVDMLCEDGNSRSGYRERRLTTSVGEITMRIPKLRMGSYFPDDVVERYSHTDRAVVVAVAEMYAIGVSTRKIEKVAAIGCGTDGIRRFVGFDCVDTESYCF